MRRIGDRDRVRYVLACSTAWNTITSLAAWRTLDPDRLGSLEIVIVPHPVTGQAVPEHVLAEILSVFGASSNTIRRLESYPVSGARTMVIAVARALLPADPVTTVWISPQEPKAYVIRQLARGGNPAARASGIVLSDDGLSFNKSLLSRSTQYWATRRYLLAVARPALDVAKAILAQRLLVLDARLTPHLDRMSNDQRAVLVSLRDALRPDEHCRVVGDAWFLSQPFEQDSNIPRGHYYGFLERMLLSWEAQGLDVRVKLHPREVATRADWVPAGVLRKALPADVSELPIELLLRRQRPRALIGISSTSLLTAALLGHTPAFSIPRESLDGIELRWHRAAILDAMRLLERLNLPPERLAEVLRRNATEATAAPRDGIPR